MNDNCAYLLIRKELYRGVGKDTEDRSGVSTVQAYSAFVTVYGAHDVVNAGPGAGVAREVRVGGLEEDFDAVEGGDY